MIGAGLSPPPQVVSDLSINLKMLLTAPA